MEGSGFAPSLLRVKTSPIASKSQEPQSKLQQSRALIRQGSWHAALTDAERRFRYTVEPPLPILKRKPTHRKVHSDFAGCVPKALGISIRTLELSIRQVKGAKKQFLVPPKPLLLPFAERCSSTSRLSPWSSQPQSRGSPVSKPHTSHLAVRPAIPSITAVSTPVVGDIHAKDGSRMTTARTVWSQKSLSGLINSFKRAKSVNNK